MPSLTLLYGVILAAVLLPCSLCVDPQYDYCKNNQICGTRRFRFPFGLGNCGLPSFQIGCVQNVRPVMGIDSQNYTILQILSDNRTFTITNDKNFQDCRFSNSIDSTWDAGNNVFDIIDKHNTSLTVYQCDEQCLPEYMNASCSPRTVTAEEATLRWNFPQEIEQTCRVCEKSKGFCGYKDLDSGEFFCFCEDGTHADQCPAHGKLIRRGIAIGVGIGSGVLMTIAIIVLAIYYRKSRSTSYVEKFLHQYVHEMPSRYSYSQLKKITNNFADKLGEGGFGVVYKGKLKSGNVVAVKILDQSRHSESQFMNEVATMGRIHHVHLVRLMGYCFERFRSALVYEYMVNGSLDKFIFNEGNEKERKLSWDQLYSIALGAARGIAYLHHDCDKHIIHFDIKPHNILLDADFTSKVADFGLAKLFRKGDDHISITATRGTPGYVAPELWSRNMGPVTDKSDVYSFGMVLLEIVGGRKNIEVRVSRSSQTYFPEWAFKLLEKGELRQWLREMGSNIKEEEKAMRLTKVGLWCIQHNSRNRPLMSRVVQMLEGNGDDVTDPPRPFDGYTSTASSSTEVSVDIDVSSVSD